MESQCCIKAAFVRGVEAEPVNVEVAISSGLPGMFIVGMADTAVQESRERVKSAIRASGFKMPKERITVNLAPGSLRKSGAGFDLPIAMGVLMASGQILPEVVENKLFVGELSLEGYVRQTLGILAFGICAQKEGLDLVSSGAQLVPIAGLKQLSLSKMSSLHLQEPYTEVRARRFGKDGAVASYQPDFCDIAGHDVAKRALQIAAAGKHGLLMIGPPGSGKTMLASRMTTILPPLEEFEMVEAAVVHSVAGEDISEILAGTRPFRHPHHSITTAGLVGGGAPIRPGEVSLAHRGVLFLDELSEFKPSSLQALRQPLEAGYVNITRAEGNIRFPAAFTLLAASNPCPCGYFGDDKYECKCTPVQINRYKARIGGPLIDRIDIQLDVKRLDPAQVLQSGGGTSSKTLREGVIRAREFASWRASREEADGLGKSEDMIEAAAKQAYLDGPARRDGQVTAVPVAPSKIIGSCRLTDEARNFLVSIAEDFSLSGRGLVSALKVARTIADLDEKMDVSTDNLAEAVGLRLRNFAG